MACGLGAGAGTILVLPGGFFFALGFFAGSLKGDDKGRKRAQIKLVNKRIILSDHNTFDQRIKSAMTET